MNAPAPPRCLDCEHCEMVPNVIDKGICRLEPPVPMVIGMAQTGPVFACVPIEVELTKMRCSHFKRASLIQTSNIKPFEKE